MLMRVDRPKPVGTENKNSIPGSVGPIDFDVLISAARRQMRVLLASGSVGLLLGFGYITTATPKYTATADLIIDSQKDKTVASSIAELTFDTGAIDSQVEVLKSEKIALSVISTLQLTKDPEFVGAGDTAVGKALTIVASGFDIGGWFATGKKSDAEGQVQLRRAALAQLKSGLDVRRVARTYVLAIEYTSPNPEKAAAIANAFAEAYLTYQLESKYDATRRASDWMLARLAELKVSSLNSDLAVQKFKAENGLVMVSGNSGVENGSNGDNSTLVSDQQMTELNAQLALARSDTARAEARYNQITEMLKSGYTDGAVTDSLGNAVITDLRQKYLTASKTEADLESKLGRGHLAVVHLRGEMAEYQRLIYEELKRIADSYRSEGEVARAKEQSLNNSMSVLAGLSAGTNQTMVQLRELEREEDTYRTLYKTFLQRYQETVQQQSFPVTEASVITAATNPRTPSYPKRSLVLALSLVLGSMTGIGIGALREYRDRVFRVATQVSGELGLEFLGMLGAVSQKVSVQAESEHRNPRQVTLRDPLLRYAIDHPLSSFAETLRSIKVAADLALLDHQSKVIGIISALPDEGKSTIAKNLASLLAHLGARTLLIDGDFRNPGLSRSIAFHAEAGVLEALRKEVSFVDLLFHETDSQLFVLPTVIKKRVHHTAEVLSSNSMRELFDEAKKLFDYIIVDLPPLGPVVDVRAAASLFDGFVFVIEWGRTARAVVQTMLASDEMIYEKCLGVVFNKVQMDKIQLYDNCASKDFYYGSYSKYYRENREITSV